MTRIARRGGENEKAKMRKTSGEGGGDEESRERRPRCSAAPFPGASCALATTALPTGQPPVELLPLGWDTPGTLCALQGPPQCQQSPSEGLLATPALWPSPGPASHSGATSTLPRQLGDVPRGCRELPLPSSPQGHAFSSSPWRSCGAQGGSRREEGMLCRAPQALGLPLAARWAPAPKPRGVGMRDGALWGCVSSRGLAQGRGGGAGLSSSSISSSSPVAQSVSEPGFPAVSRLSQEAGKQQLSSEELEKVERRLASARVGLDGSGGHPPWFPLLFPLLLFPSLFPAGSPCLANTFSEEDEDDEEQ